MSGDFDRLAAEAVELDAAAEVPAVAAVSRDDVDEQGLIDLTMTALEWGHAGVNAVLAGVDGAGPYVDAYGPGERERIARAAVVVMIRRGITSPGQILAWLGRYSAEVALVMAAMGPGVMLWLRHRAAASAGAADRREVQDGQKTV